MHVTVLRELRYEYLLSLDCRYEAKASNKLAAASRKKSPATFTISFYYRVSEELRYQVAALHAQDS